MKAHYLSIQRGQALTESVFILMILVVLLFSIEFTGRMRSHTLDLLGQSSFTSFLQSGKKVIPVEHVLDSRADKQGLLQTFEQELLQTPYQGLIKISARQVNAPALRLSANRFFSHQALQRTSFLYIQAGNSRSATETHARIAQSRMAWRNTTLPTQKLLQPHIIPLGKIDAPWRRADIQTDWLSRWADQVPGSLQRGEKK